VNYDFQIPGHAFIGLQNFSEIVNDPIARRSLVNTAILSAACVAVEFALGLLLALAMLERFRGRGLIMPVLIVPLFISPVIVGQFWSLILQPPFGPTNYLLGLLLGRPVEISWLTQTPWNFIAIVTADVWQWTPFMFVILLAGLSAIAPEMFEAAELDGASRSQTFWYVTLPQLKPLILLALTFRLLDAVKLFDVIYVMTGGGPGASTYTASFYLYQIGFQQFHLSKATAGSWIFLLLSAILIMALVRRLLRPETR
jgi:multiple sugar transport system permease protein